MVVMVVVVVLEYGLLIDSYQWGNSSRLKWVD